MRRKIFCFDEIYGAWIHFIIDIMKAKRYDNYIIMKEKTSVKEESLWPEGKSGGAMRSL